MEGFEILNSPLSIPSVLTDSLVINALSQNTQSTLSWSLSYEASAVKQIWFYNKRSLHTRYLSTNLDLDTDVKILIMKHARNIPLSYHCNGWNWINSCKFFVFLGCKTLLYHTCTDRHTNLHQHTQICRQTYTHTHTYRPPAV